MVLNIYFLEKAEIREASWEISEETCPKYLVGLRLIFVDPSADAALAGFRAAFN